MSHEDLTKWRDWLLEQHAKDKLAGLKLDGEGFENRAEIKAFCLYDLKLSQEHYDNLTLGEFWALRERYLATHPEKLQQTGEPTAVHFYSDARKAIVDIWTNQLGRPWPINHDDIIEELDKRGVRVALKKKYPRWDEAWRRERRLTRRYITKPISAVRNGAPKGSRKGPKGSKAKKV